MSLFVCKSIAFLTLFFPALCSAETPETVSVPSNDGAATMFGFHSRFPIATFDLNSDSDIEALFRVRDERTTKVKKQSELGIHGIFSVRQSDDLARITKVYDRLGRWLSVFEIRFVNDVQAVKFIPISAKKRDLQIVLSGASENGVDITGVSFVLTASAVHVHHLKWGNMGIKPILTLDVRDKLTLDHLMISDSTYDDYYAEIAEPRIQVRSYAEEGKFADASIDYVTFKNNKASSLFAIENDYLDKYGTMTFDHLTLADNQTSTMGIDISATQKVILTHASISGHKGKPALVQRTPKAEIILKDSQIPEDAYQYVPMPEYKDTPAKPVKKQ